ncbi:unnamed protein product [Bursaphelenchus xylophilus]|uniref:(pine wood nematode) hypothetical protein n=1 Tax=Bursaphelenchus xylophilus TaxID=6326 RepID=A0A1I7SV72_BURXY|nr:unnamed protein product [Bursaphelenchus xylophilus]CAG9101001.1 unnamed protein product [Bursaphelenchus xylophilus]
MDSNQSLAIERPQPFMVTSLPAYNLNLLPGYTVAGTNLLYPPGVDYNQINEFLPQMTVLLPQQTLPSISEPSKAKEEAPKALEQSLPKPADNDGMGPPTKKKIISPFSSEAKVPLPSQLDELWSYGTTVHRRNQRERDRVRQVNDGYARLREHLPLIESEKRISKVDTLRLAIIYIHHLENVVRNVNHELECVCFLHYQPSGNSSN